MILFRKWDISLINVHKTLSLGYLLFLISFILINLGMSLKIKKIRFTKSKLFLNYKWGIYLGVVFILLGILGNIVIMGGIQNYVASIGSFFTYTDFYLERAESFETNLVLSLILRSFMIPGTLLLYYSLITISKIKNIYIIIFLTLILIVFNGSTGQRSDILNLVIFIFLKYIYDNPIFRIKYLLYSTLFILSTIFLAFYRDYSQLGIEIDLNIFLNSLIPLSIHAIVSYGSNFSGVFSLLQLYFHEGLFNIDTILGPISGLLGGASPLTSQQYYWMNLIGEGGPNIRLGLFVEFFMNYGYYGIFLMIFIGAIIKIIGSSRVHFKNSVIDNTLSAFLIYMIIFIITANYSYLPRQLLFLSWPYIILHFIHVKKKNNSNSFS
tara:strand:- start:603 stop:1745 length:1143 start_codon:yes stop_codon:yes gene_type:complete